MRGSENIRIWCAEVETDGGEAVETVNRGCLRCRLGLGRATLLLVCLSLLGLAGCLPARAQEERDWGVQPAGLAAPGAGGGWTASWAAQWTVGADWHLRLGLWAQNLGDVRISADGLQASAGPPALLATARWQQGSWMVQMGSGQVAWGSARLASTLLSGQYRPFPFVQAAWQMAPALRYQRLFAQLGPQPDAFLLGQRLEWQPGGPTGPAGLAVTELAVTDGWFASHPANWVPFVPWYLTQWVLLKDRDPGANDQDNEYLALDGWWKPAPGWLVYGEFLADDMPWPFRPVQQPYQVAGLLGGQGPCGLYWEYTRVNNFTYTFQAPRLSYLQYGVPLGYPDGPDGDRLAVWWSSGRAWAGLELRRRGPGRLGQVWEEQGYPAVADRQFLAGTVEESCGAFGGREWQAGPLRIKGACGCAGWRTRAMHPGVWNGRADWPCLC